jgi:vitamin B12 transporter
MNANYTFTDLERQSRILNLKNKVNAGIDVQASSDWLLVRLSICVG